MEFKKTTRYSNGRTRLSVPQRGETTPIVTVPTPDVVQISRPSRPFSSKRLIRFAIVAGILAIITIGVFIAQGRNNPDTAIITNPGYNTVLPEGKSINSLGGWERISPPNTEPVFAYTDTIDGVSVSVSQQPLPESFKADVTGKVSELAEKFNATKKITADAVTVYLGTSAQGPQSAIFTKDNLLILIKSQENIKDDAWANYIKSLR